MAVFTFERYEKKYLISRRSEEKVIDFLTGSLGMKFDPHCLGGGLYDIYNLYFDDEQNSVINASLMKPRFKEKLRLRSYGFPKSPQDGVFLELKRKIGGIVTKRRVPLSFEAAVNLVAEGARPDGQSYVKNRLIDEILYFSSRKKLSPKVRITYRRTALYSESDPSLRITFDRDILTSRSGDFFGKSDPGTPLLNDGERLMEVKFLHAPPKALTDFLGSERIFMQGFSKYGNEYRRYRGRDYLHVDGREKLERKLING